MMPELLVCVALLAVQEPVLPSAAGPETRARPAAPAGEPDAAEQAARARYEELRTRTPETAAAQWKLALWCEQNGLTVEAYTHLTSVAQLDPKREAAWRKLGFKKHDGRWMSDAQIAEDEEQKKADKVWAPLFKKWHKDIHGGKNQAEAEAAIARVGDPRAVPSAYREFAGGGERDQTILIQVLGQIDSPQASKALAMLAVYGQTPEIRRRATETLRGRREEEFLGFLVAMMVDPVKYQVKSVGGPGSPGALVVEGERANLQRFYAPPPPPNIAFRPGDLISYDAYGMPVINRPFGPGFNKEAVPGLKGVFTQERQVLQFSVTQELVEAQKGTVAAQAQLQSDVAKLDAINDARNRFNSVVMNVAKAATGKDLGKTPKDWRDAIDAGPHKYAKRPSRVSPKPTISELALLNYTPMYVQTAFLRQVAPKDS
jgi:hypothetical protein